MHKQMKIIISRIKQKFLKLHFSLSLLIPGEAPIFLEVFTEKDVKPGESVSLKCMSTGNPLPQITWKLDGFPLDSMKNVRIGDYVTNENYVISFVNISSVSVEIGGTYSCTASSDISTIENVAPLRVSGPPYVRPMGNLTLVAHRSLSVKCPVGGYPIVNIFWEKSEKFSLKIISNAWSESKETINFIKSLSTFALQYCPISTRTFILAIIQSFPECILKSSTIQLNYTMDKLNSVQSFNLIFSFTIIIIIFLFIQLFLFSPFYLNKLTLCYKNFTPFPDSGVRSRLIRSTNSFNCYLLLKLFSFFFAQIIYRYLLTSLLIKSFHAKSLFSVLLFAILCYFVDLSLISFNNQLNQEK
uniref:Ig-like domain-containing protein n=1 Tax=Tetranychus urticae TaxID=32264 RepID=T1L4P8_TETUR